ncbi:MAG: peroxiredoxin family protein [Desulfonatronovibrio sp.]
MKNKIVISIVFVVFLFVFSGVCLAGNIPAKGDIFPSDYLKVPEIKKNQDYLGLSESMETFRIDDIQSELVLVQIFSMYCPICQREATKVNELFRLIETQGVSDKVKLLGIAPGNSDYEVDVFRDEYDVPFPLIPDPNYEWHKLMGEVGTPYFLLVQLDNREILMNDLGPFENSQELFEEIMEHLN